MPEEAKARTIDRFGSWSSSAKGCRVGAVRSAAAVYLNPRARVLLFRANHLRSRAKKPFKENRRPLDILMN
jgi:hypothetical protein